MNEKQLAEWLKVLLPGNEKLVNVICEKDCM
jgi:hypothetical protein